jgi:hypothetical protein
MTSSDLIGGQTDVGFKIVGFYEDYWGEKFTEAIDEILPQFIATKAVKQWSSLTRVGLLNNGIGNRIDSRLNATKER